MESHSYIGLDGLSYGIPLLHRTRWIVLWNPTPIGLWIVYGIPLLHTTRWTVYGIPLLHRTRWTVLWNPTPT